MGGICWDLPGCIYVAYSPERSLVKVGFTTREPERRCQGAQCDYGMALRLVISVPGYTQRDERDLHVVLYHFRAQIPHKRELYIPSEAFFSTLAEWLHIDRSLLRVPETEHDYVPIRYRVAG